MFLPPGFRLHRRPASGIGARGESAGQALGVLIAIFGFLFEAAEHDLFQVAGHVVAEPGRGNDRVAGVGDHHGHRVGTEEGRPAGEQEIGDRSHRVDIGATVRRMRSA